jgi:hypothetical protein
MVGKMEFFSTLDAKLALLSGAKVLRKLGMIQKNYCRCPQVTMWIEISRFPPK